MSDQNLLTRALESISFNQSHLISRENPFASTLSLVGFVEKHHCYPTVEELEAFQLRELPKISSAEMSCHLKKIIGNASSQIFFDVTETTYAGYNTGIQRVTRKLYNELKEVVVPFRWRDREGWPVRNSDIENAFLLNFDLLKKISIRSNKFYYEAPRNVRLYNWIKEKIVDKRFFVGLRKKLPSAWKRLLLEIAKKLLFKKRQFSVAPPINLFSATILMTEYAYLNEKTLSRLRVLAEFGDLRLTLMIHDAIPLTYPEWVASPTIAGWVHFRRLAEFANQIFVPSNSEKFIVEKLISSTSVEVSTLYLSGELLDFKKIKQAPRKKSQHRKILVLGSLDPRKNHVRVILAALDLSQRVPIELSIVAGGEWLSQNIRQTLAESEKVDNDLKIQLLIGISDQRLIEILSETDVLAFCSLAEGFGLPIAEAGFLGIPVVCSNTGTVAEIGREFANSILVDPLSIDSISSGLEMAINSKFSNKANLGKRTWSDVAGEIQRKMKF